MTERQRWRTAAELKNAVIRHCEDKFLSFAGVPWNKEWGLKFRDEHRRLWASDEEAWPYVAAIEAALASARGFLYDEERKQEGPCAKALIWWLTQDKVSGGPPVRGRTPESFRTFLLLRFKEAAQGSRHSVPEALMAPLQVHAGYWREPGESDVVGPPPDGGSYVQRRGNAIVPPIDDGVRTYFPPAFRMPDHSELAVISILCGQYPSTQRSYKELTIGEVMKAERRALREARGHVLPHKDASIRGPLVFMPRDAIARGRPRGRAGDRGEGD